MSAFDSTVKAVTNKSGTRLDVAPFPSSLTPLHQWFHTDSGAAVTGETIWPAPKNGTDKIHLMDMTLSTDAAISMALYQARQADYTALILADGATHHWELDESSGTVADGIGGKTLTATGSPTYAASNWVLADGVSVSLNGTDQGFKTTSKIASSTTGALEGWVWVSTNTGSTKIYMAAGDEGGANDYIRCAVQTDFLPQFLLRQTAGGFLQNATAKYRVANRTWTHIVWQLDGTNGLQCFINGREVGLTVTNTGSGWYDDIQSVVDNFTIGYVNINTTAAWFLGKISNVAWYTSAKTEAVWRSHYELGAPLTGPHYFAASGGSAQGQRTPLIARAGRPVYVKTSSSANATIDLWGYEAA